MTKTVGKSYTNPQNPRSNREEQKDDIIMIEKLGKGHICLLTNKLSLRSWETADGYKNYRKLICYHGENPKQATKKMMTKYIYIYTNLSLLDWKGTNKRTYALK